jgi:hypothetical protein
MKKIKLEKLKELNFEKSGASSICAASGLVKINNLFYVIADDEYSLGIFSSSNVETDHKIKLFSTHLPVDLIARKKVKADWESLVYFCEPTFKGLMAIPSGSELNRKFGCLLEIGKVSTPATIDFGELFESLRNQIKNLNIEGACVTEKTLKLFQRGNGRGSQNAIVDLDLIGSVSDIKSLNRISAERILDIQFIDLGRIKNFNYGFTDACWADGKLWYLAAAEATDSTYDDGAFCGAVLGTLDKFGNQLHQYELDIFVKPEGLWVECESGGYRIYVVTDADDSCRAASFFTAKL